MAIDWDRFHQIKGFLDPEEALKLYEITLSASGPCLEIGSYCGKSALCIGSACFEKGTTLYSVDHHRGSEEQQPGEGYFDPELFDPKTGRIDTLPFFRQTIEQAGLEETVIPIVASSQATARDWRTPLGLLFIDGGHSYETVYGDYIAWAGHILADGFLLIHDIFQDPKDGGQAPYRVYRQAIESGKYEPLPRCNTLGILRRKK